MCENCNVAPCNCTADRCLEFKPIHCRLPTQNEITKVLNNDNTHHISGNEIECNSDLKIPENNDIQYQSSHIGDSHKNAHLSSSYTLCNPEHLQFNAKGLHVVNLNIQHFLPKFDEIIILHENRLIDIFGFSESFLTLSQTTNFRLFQTEKVCRQQFEI